MSVLDGLTGLYNRRQFELGLEQEFNRTKRHPADFSLAILDIDFFKKVNDTYGHQAGDAVLRQVAQKLKNNSCRRNCLNFKIFLSIRHQIAENPKIRYTHKQTSRIVLNIVIICQIHIGSHLILL
jgi:hypothetical protein